MPQDAPVSAPPLRMLMLGPRGAGKTLQGRLLAEKLGIFHVSFRERLQVRKFLFVQILLIAGSILELGESAREKQKL